MSSTMVKEMESSSSQLVDTEMSSWLEMNRSLSLFFAITRLLASTALIILIASNPEPLYALLMVDTATGDKLEGIPKAFAIIVIGILVMATLSSILGIWGYARLNSHLLTFYGWSLLLTMVWVIYFIIMVATEESINYNRVTLFNNYKWAKKTRIIVNILQQEYKCCGIKGYRFEDLVPLPLSCCPNVTEGEVCTKENAYSQRCSITSYNIYHSMNASGLISVLPYICLVWFSSTILEAFLCYNMVHNLAYRHLDY